jgi:hypothetical protein
MTAAAPPRRTSTSPWRCLLITTLAFILSVSGSIAARATFTNAAAGTTVVSAHQLLASTLSCGGGGILQITLNWTAPADTTQPDVYGSGFRAAGYELLRSSSSGGPYTVRATVALGTTSYTDSISSGHWYYVVRTTKHSWKGPISNQRHVQGLLFLAASCE